MLVLDNNNGREVKLSPTLGFLASWGDAPGPDQLRFPRALAVDGAGNSYVADTANNRIQVYGPSGLLLREWGSSGRGGGNFAGPRGVATDATGELVVADTANQRLE
ncbi:MAG TPA: hypothetical protein VFR49_08135, partial [Solirubrobacteraceae bacterium]|nr:hypothetical protein [Solirubrobacteraceae bacterium]